MVIETRRRTRAEEIPDEVYYLRQQDMQSKDIRNRLGCSYTTEKAAYEIGAQRASVKAAESTACAVPAADQEAA